MQKINLHVVATKVTIKIEKDPSANLSLFPQIINLFTLKVPGSTKYQKVPRVFHFLYSL